MCTDRITDGKVLGFGLGFGYFLLITGNRRQSPVGYEITGRTLKGLRCPTLPRGTYSSSVLCCTRYRYVMTPTAVPTYDTAAAAAPAALYISAII